LEGAERKQDANHYLGKYLERRNETNEDVQHTILQKQEMKKNQ